MCLPLAECAMRLAQRDAGTWGLHVPVLATPCPILAIVYDLYRRSGVASKGHSNQPSQIDLGISDPTESSFYRALDLAGTILL